MGNHLYEAQELKSLYPKHTNKFTIFEVERIWEEYSESYAAEWIEPNEQSICFVFAYFGNEEEEEKC